MAAPTYVGTTTDYRSDTADFTIAFPSGMADGDLCVLYLVGDPSNAGLNWHPTSPSGYTRDTDDVSQGWHAFHKRYVSGDGASLSVNGGRSGVMVRLAVFRGDDSTTPIAAMNFVQRVSTTAHANAMGAAWADSGDQGLEIILVQDGNGARRSSTTPGGFTKLDEYSGAGNGGSVLFSTLMNSGDFAPAQDMTCSTAATTVTWHFVVAPALPPPPSQTVTLPKLTGAAATLLAPTLVRITPTLVLPKLTNTAVLRAVAVRPTLYLTLPKLTDATAVLSPSLSFTQVVTLPHLVGAAILRVPTVAFPSQPLTLPKLTGAAATLRAPSVAFPTQVVTLPHLVGAATLRAMTVAFPGQPLTLPKLTGAAATLRAPVLLLASGLHLPLLVDDQVLYPFVIEVGPITLTLPLLVNDSVFPVLLVEGGQIAITVDVSHRYWGSEDPGPASYYWGQSIEVVGEYHDALGQLANPQLVVVQIEAPDKTHTEYVYGVEALLEKMAHGVYRMRVVGDQDGLWLFRWTGTDGGGRSVPTAEGDFKVRKTHFSAP